MMPDRVAELPEVPPTVEDLYGHPRFGTYRGELEKVALERLRGPFSLPAPIRFLKHKRWTYAQVVTPEAVAVAGIAHLGYTANAFVTAVDLRSRTRLFDSGFLALPGTRAEITDAPGEGLRASFRRPGARVEIRRERPGDRYVIDIAVRPLNPLAHALHWNGEIAAPASAPAITVISPVAPDGVVNVTQKRAALQASGALRIGHRRVSLDGGIAGVDYTNGLLARNTRWHWAMMNGRLVDGTPIGLNLVEGINDVNAACNENALWLGDQLHPLPRARFRPGAFPTRDAWRVETVDDSVSLRFEPVHTHRDERDLKIVRSRFLQPLGLFSGTIRAVGRTLEIRDLGGVTEIQDILW
ncbi:MAG TPA: DUF2804 domain-containing protein [Myxococcaceae bacterium]|nr:DUF2804 domain-containing protein [Myxococcaceae bacterium]